jgi:serine/threonine-protein kinase RsbW
MIMADPVRVCLVLPRAPRAELLATRAIEEAGQRIAFPRDTLAEVKLAVVEACLNAMEYGTGEVEVEVIAHPNDAHPWIEVAVVDHGPGFDASAVPRPVLEDKLRSTRKRGWGLELIRRLMDEVEITSQPGLTRVRMIRRRGGQ